MWHAQLWSKAWAALLRLSVDSTGTVTEKHHGFQQLETHRLPGAIHPVVPFRQSIIYPCHGSQGDKLWTLSAARISPLPSRFDSSLLVAHTLRLICIQTLPTQQGPPNCTKMSLHRFFSGSASTGFCFSTGSWPFLLSLEMEVRRLQTPALSLSLILSQGPGSKSYAREERSMRDRPSEDLPRQRNLVWEALVPWDSSFLSQQGDSHSISSWQWCN